MASSPTWHIPVAQAVAQHFRVPLAQVFAHNRHKRVALARHVCWHIHYIDGRTCSEIGRAYNVDHSSVTHGKGRIHAMRTADTDFAREIAALMLSLNEGRPAQPVYEITIPPGSVVNIIYTGVSHA